MLDVKGRTLNELVGKTSKLELHLDVQAKVIIVQNYHVEIGGEADTSRPICVEFKHLRRSRRLAPTKRTDEKMQGTSNRTGGLVKKPKLAVPKTFGASDLPTSPTHIPIEGGEIMGMSPEGDMFPMTHGDGLTILDEYFEESAIGSGSVNNVEERDKWPTFAHFPLQPFPHARLCQG